MMRYLSIVGLLFVYLAAPAHAAPLCDKLGFAGLLAKCNRETLPPITLASGKPLAERPLQLQSGA